MRTPDREDEPRAAPRRRGARWTRRRGRRWNEAGRSAGGTERRDARKGMRVEMQDREQRFDNWDDSKDDPS